MIRINDLDWVETGKVNNERVAVLTFDAVNDLNYQIQAMGSDSNGQQVIPKYAIVDNLINSDAVTFFYAPLTFVVPPYTRRTYRLPTISQNCSLTMIGGTTIITFCETDMNVPDEQNMQSSVSSGVSMASGNRYAWSWAFGGGTPPAAGETIFLHTHDAPVTYPNNFNGAVYYAISPPTAPYVIDITDENAAVRGTLTLQPDGSYVFVSTGGLSFDMPVGSTLIGIGAVVPDATLADFNGTFVATQV
jgi:hypothetical protein